MTLCCTIGPEANRYLVPIVSGIVDWMLLGEHFGVLKVIGASMTLSGLALARRSAVG